MPVRRPSDAPTASLQRKGGGTGDHVLVVRTGDRLEVFALPGTEVVIGRGSDADLVIDNESISRAHVRLVLGDTITLEDLGSRNGVTVRGSKLAKRAPVAIGISEPFQIADVLAFVERGRKTPRPVAGGAIVRDPKMVQLYAIVDVIARSDLRVLLLGETGTGKEVIAKTIHTRSLRAAKPFLAINCGALVETMLEAELFGFERGAFTGADQAKPGLFEAAHRGTLFLDEVGELSATTQAKLLRVLEAGEVMRLGSVTPKRVDVRVVSATNRDLRAMIAAGTFRQDLYYRLDGTSLAIPPLRDRVGDIAPLARAFAELAAAPLGKPTPKLSAAAIDRLESYGWPGNVRELRNVIERAVVLHDGTLEAEHFELAAAPPVDRSLWSEVEAVEYQRIASALAATGGNQTAAAKRLGIARTTLIRRIEHFGITRPKKL